MKRGNESKGTLDRSHWNPGVREKQSEPSVTMSQHHGQRQLVMCRPPVSLCSMMLCLWLGSGLPAGKSPSLDLFICPCSSFALAWVSPGAVNNWHCPGTLTGQTCYFRSPGLQHRGHLGCSGLLPTG